MAKRTINPKSWIYNPVKLPIMKTYLSAPRKWICLIGVFCLLGSCDNSNNAQAQPVVVRKKIDIQATAPPTVAAPAAVAAGAPQTAAPQATEAAPANRPAPVSAASQAPVAEAPAPAPNAAPGPETLASVSGSKPALVPNPASAEPQKLESSLAASESPVAALLNTQVPPPYNPVGKINPFEPFLREESSQEGPVLGKALRRKREPQSPLEKIDLGQLKLVAIIVASSGNRALVEEASGKGYILKEGTYVGLNSGKVVDIQADKVFIEEEYEDVYGKAITKKKEITLPKPPGE
jgi:type IV pilus assembly protein PilP